MNRLLKKCMIASGGLHVFLVLILLIGPGFFKPKVQEDDTPILQVIPDVTTDGRTRGGNHNATPPPPAIANPPPAPTPPAPTPAQRPTPEPPAPQPVRNNSATEPADKPVKAVHKIQLNLTPVVRKPGAVKTSTEVADNSRAEQADKLRREINNTLRTLRSGFSAATTIEMPAGSDDGPAAANYAQVVKSIYTQAWIAPDDAASDQAVTKVRVTIRSDGVVLSASVVQPSGDAQVDQSVRRTLDRVTFIAPFPEGSTDKPRTYTLTF